MGKGLAAFFVPTANKLRVFVPSYEINADEEHYCSPPQPPPPLPLSHSNGYGGGYGDLRWRRRWHKRWRWARS